MADEQHSLVRLRDTRPDRLPLLRTRQPVVTVVPLDFGATRRSDALQGRLLTCCCWT